MLGTTIINVIGISGMVAIGGLLIYIGRKLQILDTIETTMSTLGNDFRKLYDRFSTVESRVEALWEGKISISKSPRQLNDLGNKILNESGIKQIVEKRKDKLLEIVKEKNPLANGVFSPKNTP